MTDPVRITEPGFYHLTPEDYFADPCPDPSLSQSGIKTLVGKTAARFAHEHPRLGSPKEALSKANRLRGDICHRLALGRGKEYRVGDFADWRTKAAQEFKAQCAADNVTPALAKDMEGYARMAAIAKARIEELFKGKPYETEVVMVWREETAFGPIWCRGMLDAHCPSLGMAADPKFTDLDATEETFAKQANTLGYAVQNRFYKRGIAALEPRLAGRIQFRHLMIESAEPNCSQAFDLSGAYQAVADSRISVAMHRFGECMKRGVWPGYAPGVRRVEPPAWVLKGLYEQEEAAA